MLTSDEIICPPPAVGEMFDPHRAFGRAASFELEIGSGKGGFLLRRAQDQPERDFLGIEWANKYFLYAADRMARRGLVNVRMMRTDARHFVINHLPDACVAVLHVYHPDPWPKARHHKRRLFQLSFVNAVVRVLVPGGRLAVQTDHAEYFEWIKAHLGAAPILAAVPYEDAECGIAGDGAETNFEIKYRREGRDIFSLARRKHA